MYESNLLLNKHLLITAKSYVLSGGPRVSIWGMGRQNLRGVAAILWQQKQQEVIDGLIQPLARGRGLYWQVILLDVFYPDIVIDMSQELTTANKCPLSVWEECSVGHKTQRVDLQQSSICRPVAVPCSQTTRSQTDTFSPMRTNILIPGYWVFL